VSRDRANAATPRVSAASVVTEVSRSQLAQLLQSDTVPTFAADAARDRPRMDYL